jgi:hypothetical protein
MDKGDVDAGWQFASRVMGHLDSSLLETGGTRDVTQLVSCTTLFQAPRWTVLQTVPFACSQRCDFRV